MEDHEIRYTPKHGQEILWEGNGLYHWDGGWGVWVKLSMDEAKEYVADPSSRRGLYKAFTRESTLTADNEIALRDEIKRESQST